MIPVRCQSIKSVIYTRTRQEYQDLMDRLRLYVADEVGQMSKSGGSDYPHFESVSVSKDCSVYTVVVNDANSRTPAEQTAPDRFREFAEMYAAYNKSKLIDASVEYVTMNGNLLSKVGLVTTGAVLALSDNIRTEAAAVRSNYDLVVAVSHDIRTPLTSLALYLDLILTGKYREPDQVLETVEKARGKVTQIKQMTDQLFERFIFEKNEDQPPEAPAPIRAIFEDALSGAVGYLEENGFQIKADVCWPDRKARVVGEYVSRIVDNLCSNILKYAEPAQPVLLSVYEYENDLRIRLSNKCRRLTEQPESTGIGLENVRFMMHRMGGACRMTIANGVYTICLTFRCTTDE